VQKYFSEPGADEENGQWNVLACGEAEDSQSLREKCLREPSHDEYGVLEYEWIRRAGEVEYIWWD
jgi:hypothetical protein